MELNGNEVAAVDLESLKATVKRFLDDAVETVGNGRTLSQDGPPGSSANREEQQADVIKYVQEKLDTAHNFQASVSELEARLRHWGFLKSSGFANAQASSGAPSTPPSPYQAGLRDDPEWIMVSTFSKLGISSDNNISFLGNLPKGWNSLPSENLEEHLRSLGIDTTNQKPFLGGTSLDMISSILLSKELTGGQQTMCLQDRYRTLASFFPTENNMLITDDQIFETNFIRVLIFSMLNGFAGLDDIPMENILKFLRRLVVSSVFLRILVESPRHISRTLSDNIFRAAIEAKDVKVVSILLDCKLVDVNGITCGQRHPCTPLQRAASLGALDLVRTLVASGADVNKKIQERSADVLSRMINAACPRDFARNLQFKAAVTMSPDFMETCDVLVEAGFDVRTLHVMSVAQAFTTYDLVGRLSVHVPPAKHKHFFRDHIKAACEFSDGEIATELVKAMLEKCEQAGCGQCLGSDAKRLQRAAIAAAQRGYISLVKVLLQHDSLKASMHILLTAAISSDNQPLIDYILSHDPELNPPAFSLDHSSDGRTTTPIAEAVKMGNKNLIKIFEEAGALENITEGARFEPLLLAAVRVGNVPYVTELVRRATTSKESFRDSGRAIAIGITNGHKDITEILLSAGFRADKNTNRKLCPLEEALKKQDPSLVHAILDANPGRTRSNDLGKALAQWCNPAILWDVAVAEQQELSFRDDDLEAFCQRCMEMNDVPFCIRYLFEALHLEREEAEQCLALAIRMKNPEMIQGLLDSGVDPFADAPMQAAITQTPEMLRRWQTVTGQPRKLRRCIGAPILKFLMADTPENSRKLDALLQTGTVDLTTPRWLYRSLGSRRYSSAAGDDAKLTPLGLAIQGVSDPPRTTAWGNRLRESELKRTGAVIPCGPNLEAVKRLLQAGSDPNGIARSERQGFNKTPLMLAIKAGRADIVELLVANGADVNHHTSFHTKRSPLQYAAEIGHLDMVRLLLNHGADANGAAHTRGGGTALQFAAIGGSCPLADELLEHGAIVDALPSRIDGRWPLEAAAEHGRLDMIRFLWGFNTCAMAAGVHHDGFAIRHCLRAMSFAKENGHMGCVALIEELSGLDSGMLDTEEYGASWIAY
ncbi:hypothetical protein S40293_09908 [Stachybotrys chartarum IBT 40293]|nr:hypothetical protein S40293_09908 [Stachybotrys chartarum IBT 40293]